MKRRDFLKVSAVAGVATVCGTQRAAAQGQTGGGNGMPKPTPPEKPAELNLCLQWDSIPGGEIEADQYVDGFKGLKLIGYRGAVSFEGGWPRNPADPRKGLPQEEKTKLILNMVKLLREQWAMA